MRGKTPNDNGTNPLTVPWFSAMKLHQKLLVTWKLIERESVGNDDKPIIAVIIWNRLNQEMKLEINSTIQN